MIKTASDAFLNTELVLICCLGGNFKWPTWLQNTCAKSHFFKSFVGLEWCVVKIVEIEKQ